GRGGRRGRGRGAQGAERGDPSALGTGAQVPAELLPARGGGRRADVRVAPRRRDGGDPRHLAPALRLGDRGRGHVLRPDRSDHGALLHAGGRRGAALAAPLGERVPRRGLRRPPCAVRRAHREEARWLTVAWRDGGARTRLARRRRPGRRLRRAGPAPGAGAPSSWTGSATSACAWASGAPSRSTTRSAPTTSSACSTARTATSACTRAAWRRPATSSASSPSGGGSRAPSTG